ncbi:MAG: hypothetical protein IPJ61_17540 [Tessaracoccus sp.]|uniref:hypothetical protein n=1 Tax=Tessaracoccus sp. TaxID=1971211 RepID=UPI001EC22382|nr:hypothetical protein [Tessaracoccus sp.]MBK7822810.1 hypothetical protein [Tessaracoccus sp.]
MPPLDPNAPWWANLAVMMAAVAAPVIISHLSTRRKFDGQSRQIQRLSAQQAAIKGDTAASREQLENSHPTNLRDDLDRVEGKLDALGDGVDRVEQGQRRHDAEIAGIRATLSQQGQVDQQLAQADHEDRTNARDEHNRIWQAIKGLRSTQKEN